MADAGFLEGGYNIKRKVRAKILEATATIFTHCSAKMLAYLSVDLFSIENSEKTC